LGVASWENKIKMINANKNVKKVLPQARRRMLFFDRLSPQADAKGTFEQNLDECKKIILTLFPSANFQGLVPSLRA